MTDNENKDPLSGWDGALAKFIASGLFRGMVSFIVFGICMQLGVDIVFGKHFYHMLWAIPLLWGICGIFYFDEMLDAGRRLVESFVRSD